MEPDFPGGPPLNLGEVDEGIAASRPPPLKARTHVAAERPPRVARGGGVDGVCSVALCATWVHLPFCGRRAGPKPSLGSKPTKLGRLRGGAWPRSGRKLSKSADVGSMLTTAGPTSTHLDKSLPDMGHGWAGFDQSWAEFDRTWRCVFFLEAVNFESAWPTSTDM